ncbi:MAG: Polyprenyl synthetase [uncultured bacterium]|nr:MAG: Polyprenyl synthetase [uncultured bacterium]HBH17568.1 farnesyl-diphosphate synthase [Cyanobacteria bacterium UBA9579]
MKIVQQQDSNLVEALQENKKLINTYLEKYLEIRYPQIIWESMRYTTLSDGKRIRPVLALESARACGGNIENVIPTACAIEMIHAQSLIHDDLPCMDNDDYRRGRLTNHKVYGEAFAVLAGDALLSYAPQIIIQHTPAYVDRDLLFQVLEELAIAAGALGLIGGQVIDIDSENKEIDIPTFNYIHTHKTGELFKFAMRSGALLSQATDEQLEILTEYGRLVGYAFQIADDILDITGTKESLGKTPGKDKLAKKNTHPSLFGLSQSKEEVEQLCSKAQQILIDNKLDTPLLIGIAGSIALKVMD